MSARIAALLRCLALALFLGVGGAAAAEFERGLLWQVWRPGVAPSHIFGTLHLPDERLLLLPAPVERAFSGARRFVMEMYPDEHVAARFSEAGRLDGGERLDRMLSPQSFAAVARLLEARGFAPGVAPTLKPWAALLALTGREARDGVVTLDNDLYIRARLANMRVEELDTVEEQIAAFDALPRESQLALLQAGVEAQDRLAEMAERTVRAYLARDLGALDRLSHVLEAQRPELRPHRAILEKGIIHDRSVVMAHRLQSHLRRGRTFAAVGALHLYGPKGILSLLRHDGWRVRRIY